MSFCAGQYGLRNKREVWRVKYTLAKIRKAARELLTLEEKSTRRLFEGNALLRRLVRIGVLDEKNEARLCSGFESGRFPGATTSDTSVQAGSG